MLKFLNGRLLGTCIEGAASELPAGGRTAACCWHPAACFW
jgi:hypothetical protein